MGIVSYAQNFEDVILWRALGHVGKGWYVDIGAQDPVFDSVSKAFYEQGWRGIHVEPTTTYAGMLRSDRPDETVLQAVVAERPGVASFYEIPGTGLSTARKDIADKHREACGYAVNTTTVTCLTLDDVFSQCPADVHWLKIDVEGYEHAVLAGWRGTHRPWIVVIESTLPGTQVPSHADWEPMLLEKTYECVYFDGVNRYYLAAAHSHLKAHFADPPNVFDAFQVARSSHMTLGIAAEYASEKADFQARLEAAAAREQALQKSAELASAREDVLAAHAEMVLALRTSQEGLRRELAREIRRGRGLERSLRHAQERATTMEVAEREMLRRHDEQIGAAEALRQRHAEAEREMLRRYDEQLGTAEALRQRHAEVEREMLRRYDEQLGAAEALRQKYAEAQESHRSEIRSLQSALDAGRHDFELMRQDFARQGDTAVALARKLAAIQSHWAWKASHWLYGAAGESASAAGFPIPGRRFEHPGGNPGAAAKPTDPAPAHPESLPMNMDELLSLPRKPFIKAAYRRILGREADEAGVRHYLRELRRGAGKAAVLYDLSASREAEQLGPHRDLAPLSDAAFIDAVYRRLLGRSPDPGGLRHYAQMVGKTGGRSRMLRDIQLSPEARARDEASFEFHEELEAMLVEERNARKWWGFRARAARDRRSLARMSDRLDELGVRIGAMTRDLDALDAQSCADRSAPATSAAATASDSRRISGLASPLRRPVFELTAGLNTAEPATFFDALAKAVAMSSEAGDLQPVRQ